MDGLAQKLNELVNKIDLPTMFEAQKKIVEMVNSLPLTDEQKKEVNDKYEEIQQKLKELGND